MKAKALATVVLDQGVVSVKHIQTPTTTVTCCCLSNTSGWRARASWVTVSPLANRTTAPALVTTVSKDVLTAARGLLWA